MTSTEQPVSAEQRRKEIEALREYQAGVKQREESKKVEAEKVKAFKIDDFLVSDDVLEMDVMGVGLVKYKMISAAEFFEVMADSGNRKGYESNMLILHNMMSKADPSVTLEKLRKMDPKSSSRLMGQLLSFLT